VRRLNIFAKGNVDVHDSLHSCRIGGEVLWNGINDIVRRHGATVRLRHETWTRSDAILQANGTVPGELTNHALQLGSYPAQSQFSAALFENDTADAFVFSILGETATALVRHNQAGFLFYPADSDRWAATDRDWLRSDFTRLDLLDVDTSMRNLRAIIDRIRERSEAPILVYNVSPIVPGETVHCLQGLGEIYATKCRRFNLGLAEISEELGISIVDVDSVLARAGADRLKIDAMHLTPEGYRLVAEEVVRILVDLDVMPAMQEQKCEPA
jgi:GDSL-like Lipase/Acylhydrolase family